MPAPALSPLPSGRDRAESVVDRPVGSLVDPAEGDAVVLQETTGGRSAQAPVGRHAPVVDQRWLDLQEPSPGPPCRYPGQTVCAGSGRRRSPVERRPG